MARTYLTREQAKIQLQLGKKITHVDFESYQYIKKKRCKIVDETGDTYPQKIFWKFRSHGDFAAGWFEFEH